MDVTNLLPKDKFDIESIFMLNELNDEDLKPIIFNLFTWTQDANWPIYQSILQLMIKKQHLIIPYIPNVLEGNDTQWQYWLLKDFIPKLESYNIKILSKYVEQFIKPKENNEEYIELAHLARKILK